MFIGAKAVFLKIDIAAASRAALSHLHPYHLIKELDPHGLATSGIYINANCVKILFKTPRVALELQ